MIFNKNLQKYVIQSKDLQSPIYSIYDGGAKQWGIGAKQRKGGDAN